MTEFCDKTEHLFNAMRDENLEESRKLIDELDGEELDVVDYKRRTPLCYAAANEGFDEILSMLIERGADINHQNVNGYTPLMFAVRMNRLSIVKMLQYYGHADVNIRGKYGETALIFACSHETSIEMVRLLLDEGAMIDAYTTRVCEQPTALFGAIRQGNLDLVRLLLERGANPNQSHHKTHLQPIHAAAEMGNPKILELLLIYKADVNARYTTDITPLGVAAIYDRVENAEILIRYGADINYRGRSGFTPLIDACFSVSHGVANIILNHADINIAATDDEGRTALWHICGASLVTKVTPPGESEDYHKNARQQLLKRMLDNGADPNHKPLREYSPLLETLYRKEPELATILLDAGADFDEEHPVYGYTPLKFACQYRLTDVAKRLIEMGADVERRYDSGETIWMYAAYDNELIKMLEDRGLSKMDDYDEDTANDFTCGDADY